MKFAGLILPLLVTAAGFAQDIRYNFDQKADFSKFRTYKWVQVKDSPQMNNLVDEQIKTSIEAELAKKGLTKVTGDEANLYVAYQVTVSQEKEFSSYSTDFGYGPGWGRGWYGGGMGSTMTTGQTSTIHIGELAVDMYDPTAKALVWRGTASKTLDPKAKPDKRQKNLAKGLAKLFKNYPPAPKKG